MPGLWHVGLAVVLYASYRMAWWVWVTFLRPINLKPYRGAQSWAVITGATDGIGLAFAKVLARHGLNLILVSRSQEKLDAVKRSLQAGSPKVQIDVVVSDAAVVTAANIQRVTDRCLSRDISILINNVGVGQGGIKPLQDLSDDAIAHAVTVNCTYPSLLTKALLPHMFRRTGRKLIINISSIAALIMNPFSSIYAGSKAFNRQFSRALSAELAHRGFDVLRVNPGFVESNMTKMKPSPICCSALECAEATLRKIGEVEVIPHWKHCVMYAIGCVSNMLPTPIWPAGVYCLVRRMREATGRLNKE